MERASWKGDPSQSRISEERGASSEEAWEDQVNCGLRWGHVIHYNSSYLGGGGDTYKHMKQAGYKKSGHLSQQSCTKFCQH